MFYCEEIDEQNLLLRYESERIGLTPLVIGLLNGLADRFNVKILLKHTKNQSKYGYDEFNIQLMEIEEKIFEERVKKKEDMKWSEKDNRPTVLRA